MAKNKKQDSAEKVIYQKKLAELNEAVQRLKTANLPIPDVILKKIDIYESKLNKNKYGAKKDTTSVEGQTFDSQFEAKVALFLTKSGVDYKTQVKFKLMEDFKLVYPEDSGSIPEIIQDIEYHADFVISDKIIIDVKGNNATQTAAFNIKWKLLKNKLRDKYYYILIGNNTELAMAIGKIKVILSKIKTNNG